MARSAVSDCKWAIEFPASVVMVSMAWRFRGADALGAARVAQIKEAIVWPRCKAGTTTAEDSSTGCSAMVGKSSPNS